MKFRVSKEYKLETRHSSVSRAVAEEIDNLRNCGIPEQHILGIYLDSQKKNITKRSNSCDSFGYNSTNNGLAKDEPKLGFGKWMNVYNQAIRKWKKISPSDFLPQYMEYVGRKVNDFGIEYGFVAESFVWRSLPDEDILIIDAHPFVITECQKQQDKHISFAFTDAHYYQAYNLSEKKPDLVDLDKVSEKKYQRVLVYAADRSSEEIERTLMELRNKLTEETKTNIYLYTQTRYFNKRNRKPGLWAFLMNHYTIQKIVLIDSQAVRGNPKSRCLVIVQNKKTKNRDIQIQKTRLINENKLATLEFRSVSVQVLGSSDRTLSAIYDTDYNNYENPRKRNKPEEYRFLNEISIWVSFSRDSEGKWRPCYRLYKYPTEEQRRRNVFARGKLIKERITGKWYADKQSALESAEELLLNNSNLARAIRKEVLLEYSDKPISLKTHIFIHLEELRNSGKVDDEWLRAIFFQPNSADSGLCSLEVGIEDSNVINVLQNHVDSLRCSGTDIDEFWNRMKTIFAYACIDGKYKHNPILKVIDKRRENNKDYRNMRGALVNRSFSHDQELVLVNTLCFTGKNLILASLMLTKLFTGLKLNELRALTWGDYVGDGRIKQLSVTKTVSPKGDKVEAIMPEIYRRFVPVATIVAQLLDKRRANGEGKSKNQPLFPDLSDSHKMIPASKFRRFSNKVLKELNLPQCVIPIINEDRSVLSDDINDYSGDIYRTNFEYHAARDALLEEDEIDYLLGRQIRTTEGNYYCDFKNEFVQLLMKVKLDRWVASLLPVTVDRVVHKAEPDEKGQLSVTSNPTNVLEKLSFEFDLQEDYVEQEILLKCFAQFGGKITIEFLQEE